jgi:hypothetical protein
MIIGHVFEEEYCPIENRRCRHHSSEHVYQTRPACDIHSKKIVVIRETVELGSFCNNAGKFTRDLKGFCIAKFALSTSKRYEMPKKPTTKRRVVKRKK